MEEFSGIPEIFPRFPRVLKNLKIGLTFKLIDSLSDKQTKQTVFLFVICISETHLLSKHVLSGGKGGVVVMEFNRILLKNNCFDPYLERKK